MPLNSIYENGGMKGVTLDFADTERYIIGTETATIQYRGKYSLGYVGTTSDKVVTFSTISGLQEGDVVIAQISAAPYTSNGFPDRVYTATVNTPTGWTSVASVTQSPPSSVGANTYYSNFNIVYKVMGATPDTSLTIPGGTGNSACAGHTAVMAFRGVDVNNIIYTLNATNASGTTNWTPPAITPTQAGSFILTGVTIGHSDGDDQFNTAPGMSILTSSLGGSDTADCSAGLAFYDGWVSGTFTPQLWTASVAPASTEYSTSVSLVLPPGQTIVYGNYKNSGIWNLNAVYASLQ